jgi:predicted acyl esterase
VGSGVLLAPGNAVSFTTEPLEQALRIAGLPQLALAATPSTPTGSHVFAELYDIYPDRRSVRLSWAAMNLRFHQGGNTEAQDLTPGEQVLALMEFEPTDALVARGHALQLVVHREGVEDIQPTPVYEPLQVDLGASVLRLPVVDRPTIVPTYAPVGLPG